MPIFYERPNGRRNPTIRKMGGKRSIIGKSKVINSMGQRGRNDSQQAHEHNKR